MNKLLSLALLLTSVSSFAITNSTITGNWEMNKMERVYSEGTNKTIKRENIAFSDTIGNSGVANFESEYFTELIFEDSGRTIVNYVIAATQTMPINGNEKEIVISSEYNEKSTSLIVEAANQERLVLSRRFSCKEYAERCPENKEIKSIKEFYYYSQIGQSVIDELEVNERMRSMDKEVLERGFIGAQRFSEVDEY